jgi:hypothetical protein
VLAVLEQHLQYQVAQQLAQVSYQVEVIILLAVVAVPLLSGQVQAELRVLAELAVEEKVVTLPIEWLELLILVVAVEALRKHQAQDQDQAVQVLLSFATQFNERSI